MIVCQTPHFPPERKVLRRWLLGRLRAAPLDIRFAVLPTSTEKVFARYPSISLTSFAGGSLGLQLDFHRHQRRYETDRY